MVYQTRNNGKESIIKEKLNLPEKDQSIEGVKSSGMISGPKLASSVASPGCLYEQTELREYSVSEFCSDT